MDNLTPLEQIVVALLRAGEDLHAVVTVPEAAKMWNKHKNTVRAALDDVRVHWRYAEGTILISKVSLVYLWGAPASESQLGQDFVSE